MVRQQGGPGQVSKLYCQQLTEVLSRYGEMCEVWFDGSNVVEVGTSSISTSSRPWSSRARTPRSGGWATRRLRAYPAWNAVSQADAKSGVSTAVHGKANGEAWLPNECDARIRDTWFWNTHNAPALKGLDH